MSFFCTEPPKWQIEPEGQLNVIGASVTIKCAVYGNPEPSVTWLVNGRSLSGMTLFLFFFPANPCMLLVFVCFRGGAHS